MPSVRGHDLRDGWVALHLDYTYPMKEDVKRKSFSPPLGEMRVW
jgi:hypothetical protein